MEHVIFSAAQLHDTCEILSIPVIVTEQYPKALKHTVPEIGVKRDNTTVVEKTLFSMITPVRC
jgi:predicted double-glycine peptidase